jgi:hypothetical protein
MNCDEDDDDGVDDGVDDDDDNDSVDDDSDEEDDDEHGCTTPVLLNRSLIKTVEHSTTILATTSIEFV